MEELNPYWLITAASVVVIISYFFNLISRRTNFPSVLLLLILGMLIKTGLNLAGLSAFNLESVLELLGIVGLIMIVLEAALDLKFSKEKTPIILKAFVIALLSLTAGILIITLLIDQYIDSGFLTSMIYAIPLTIVSTSGKNKGNLWFMKLRFPISWGSYFSILLLRAHILKMRECLLYLSWLIY